MNHPYGSETRKRLVVHLGCVGSGKSTNALSIQQTIADRRFPGQVIKTNAAYTKQERQLALHRRVTPSEVAEAMTIQTGDLQIDWEFWPGQHAMFDDAVDAREIASLLRVRGVDLLIVTLNPLMHDQDLAEYAFLELIWFIQEKTDFELGKSMQIASHLLWDLSEEELNSLNADLCEITAEQYREGRIGRHAHAKFGLPLNDCFAIEGCDDGGKVLDALARTARTTGADVLETLNLQAIIACRSEKAIVIGTHADLLKFLPGVGEAEFLRCCHQAFPDPTEVRVGQVLPQASLDIAIRSNHEKPVWIKGPSARAEHLLTSVVNLLSRSRRPSGTDQRNYITGTMVVVSVAAIPVAALVTTWAILPLITLTGWTLFHVGKASGFKFRRLSLVAMPKSAPREHEQDAISQYPKLDDPSIPRNRIAAHLINRNGTGSSPS